MNRDPFTAATSRRDRYGRQTTVTLHSGTWARQLRLPLAIALALLLILRIVPATPAGAASCVVTSAADSGAGTLRAHLTNLACDTITFQANLGPISLAKGLVIDHSVAVDGPGQVVQYTGSPSDTGYVLRITGGTVALRGLTFQGGRTTNFSGAGIAVYGGDITLDGVTVRDNRSGSDAGGIYVTNAALRLNNTSVEDNSSLGGSGGGIFIDNYYGDVAVTITGGSQIVGNESPASHGGGILLNRGLAGYSATLTMTDSTLGTRARPNVVDQFGGGLINYNGTLTMTNVYVGGNVARDSGGGIYAVDGVTTLTNVTIDGNTASYGGGGLGLDNGTATLTNVTISDNQAATYNGGGFSSLSSTATLTNTTFYGNTAKENGGGYMQYQGTATLANVTFSGNSAGVSGGGIFSEGGTTTLRFATITGNLADKYGNNTGTGGGVARTGGAFNLASSIVAGNRRGAALANDCVDGVTSQGNNLVGNATGCPINGAGDLALTSPLSTVLQPTLADNGGATRTHALVSNSPAIDRIPLAQCAVTTDQRGVARPQGNLCDIGAVEYAPKTALTVATVGGGTVGRNPAGSGNGPFTYDTGASVTLTAQPNAGQTFTGWVVDETNQGWRNPLTITMDTAHRVQATFAPTVSFPDVGPGRADHTAIVALASRGTIRGYANGYFGPDDRVTRAQMAALLARATPAGPGTPTNGTLTPPACTAAETWDCEDWGNNFTDRGGIVESLWRNAGTLQHYGVAFGYGADQCQARGATYPCFGPQDDVTYAQTISFITRAMIVKGYWVAQLNAPLPYAGVPGAHANDFRTFAYFTGGIPAPPANWDAPATRGWFAMALWAALDSHWGKEIL